MLTLVPAARAVQHAKMASADIGAADYGRSRAAFTQIAVISN